MLMEINCDTTDMFTIRGPYEEDVILMEFDDDVVREFYKENYDSNGKKFDEWITEYTCDEVNGLYDFAVAKGKKPKTT